MPSMPRISGRSRWAPSWTSRWRRRRKSDQTDRTDQTDRSDRSARPPHPQLEGRAAPRAGIGEAQVAPHAAGEAPAQGEPEADSRNAAGRAGRGFVERPEEPAALGPGDPWSAVLEAQHQVTPAAQG